MKPTNNTSEQIKLDNVKIKAERLCKLYNCSLLELMILSIDKQAENKKEQN